MHWMVVERCKSIEKPLLNSKFLLYFPLFVKKGAQEKTIWIGCTAHFVGQNQLNTKSIKQKLLIQSNIHTFHQDLLLLGMKFSGN